MDIIEYLLNLIAFQFIYTVISLPIVVPVSIIFIFLFEYFSLPFYEFAKIVGMIIIFLYGAALFWLTHNSAKLRVFEGLSYREAISASILELKMLVLFSLPFLQKYKDKKDSNRVI